MAGEPGRTDRPTIVRDTTTTNPARPTNTTRRRRRGGSCGPLHDRMAGGWATLVPFRFEVGPLDDVSGYRGSTQPVAGRESGHLRARWRHLRETGRQRALVQSRARPCPNTPQPGRPMVVRLCSRARLRAYSSSHPWRRRAKGRRHASTASLEDDRLDAGRSLAHRERNDVTDLREPVRDLHCHRAEDTTDLAA